MRFESSFDAFVGAVAAAAVCGAGSPAMAGPDNPVEAGLVDWGRDFEAARMTSRETGRPIFMLFQEIPGCSGCREFGAEVLSHPLIVEAVEDLFVPMLVYNNRRGGMDAELLRAYDEPAWNFQVVRFLDATGKDIIPRKDRVWSIGGIAARMAETLEAADRPVPLYLRALVGTHDQGGREEKTFAMACFWTGERLIGQIEGVLTTEAGWLGRHEVVRVDYDPDVISAGELQRAASRVDCLDKTHEAGDAPYRKARPSDQKRQLIRWPDVRELPGITEMQLTKINAIAPTDRERALAWLSPRQRQALLRGE